jgi:hypothetical protein
MAKMGDSINLFPFALLSKLQQFFTIFSAQEIKNTAQTSAAI